MIKIAVVLYAISLVWFADVTIYELILMKRRNEYLRENRMNRRGFTYKDIPNWAKCLVTITPTVATGILLGELVFKLLRGLV